MSEKSVPGALKLDTPVQFMKGVGPKLGDVLKKKGVETVQDLLEWYPRAYEDRRSARTISSLRPDELVSLRAKVIRVSSFNMGASKRKIYDVIVSDGTGKIHCKFFRVPYKGYFERFKPNQDVRVIGKVAMYRGQLEFSHPDIQDDTAVEAGEGEIVKDEVIPVYPESEGLTNRAIRKLMEVALDAVTIEENAPPPSTTNRYGEKVSASGPRMAGGGRLPTSFRKSSKSGYGAEETVRPKLEKFPEHLRKEYDLPGRLEALENVHRPPEGAGLEFTEQTSAFHRRIIFEEFFWLELYLASKKAGLQREKAPAIETRLDLVNKLRASLPFQFTGCPVSRAR